MRFINCSYENFIKRTANKRIVLFGASSAWDYFFTVFPEIDKDVLERTSCIVDNSPDKQGTPFDIGTRRYSVFSPSYLKTMSNFAVLIDVSLAYVENICDQLIRFLSLEDVECYSLFLMIEYHNVIDNSAVKKYFENRDKKKIPAKIHSFWFSGEEKPDVYKRCIESWHKHCPSFEIIEWDAKKYDVKKNDYMFESFERKKWAFVSDYARLDVVKEYGGIYMDMDVELVSSLEPLLYAEGFFCRQEDGLLELGSGFGAQPGDYMITRMLKEYEGRHLVTESGEIDFTPQPQFLNKVFLEYGFKKDYNSTEILNRIVLSNDYISCYSGEYEGNQPILGIHWHNGGWVDEKKRSLIKKSHLSKKYLLTHYFKQIRE